MTYYACHCNHCGHEGTRYSNIKKCPQCGQQWKRKTELMLEAYPNISPDHMGSAVRQIIRHVLRRDEQLKQALDYLDRTLEQAEDIAAGRAEPLMLEIAQWLATLNPVEDLE